MRNAIRAEAPEAEGEFKIAECVGESELAENGRGFGAGRVVTKESAGRQLGATAPASTEELLEACDE